MMYLDQNPDVEDWLAIAVYPRRGLEPDNQSIYSDLLRSARFQIVYLEDFLGTSSQRIGVQLMQLIVAKRKDTAQYLEALVPQLQGRTEFPSQAIIECISTIMVYKFPQLSREEIESMFSVSDLKQTKVYQEALDEGLEQGRLEGELTLLFRLLKRRIGSIAPETEAQLRALSLDQIEQLGEDLLDFTDRTDLDAWLNQAE